MTDEPTRARPPLLRAVVAVAVVDALALAAYGVVVGLVGLSGGSTVAAAPVEMAVYLLFAAGIAFDARLLAARRRAGRTPFGVVQLFGLVTGWTLTQGDGDLTHRIGYAVLALSVVGIALVLSPALGEALDS